MQEDKVFAVVGTLGTEVNQAIQPYLNSARVPHVLVSTGASNFGKDYKKYPWTIGWQPDYVAEGRLYGLDIARNKPNAKIAILYQNDSYGKDYVNGFKSALGSAKSRQQIVGEEAFEVTSPSPASQLVKLQASGADTLVIFVTTTKTIQTYAIIRALGWKPPKSTSTRSRRPTLHDDRRSASSSAATVNGSISAAYLKDPASPTWANDAIGEAVRGADGEVQPAREGHRRAQLLRLRQGGHIRAGDVQGREEPDAGGSDEGAPLVQRDEPVPAPGVADQDRRRRITSSSRTADRCASTTASGRCSAGSSTGARAASALSLRIDRTGAGDSPAPVSASRVASVDLTLTAEQELIRESARDLCRAELVPHAQAWDHAEELPRSLVGTLAEAGFLAAALPGGARRRRPRLGLLLPPLRGARQGRFVGARDRLGLERALREDDREVGERRAARRAPAGARERRGARLLRAHRARLRLGRGGARDARRPRRRRVGADGLEGLHHARLVGGDGDRLRAHRRAGAARDHGVPRPDGRGRLRGAGR